MSDMFFNEGPRPASNAIRSATPSPKPPEVAPPKVTEPRKAGESFDRKALASRNRMELRTRRVEENDDAEPITDKGFAPATRCSACAGAELEQAKYTTYCQAHKREWSKRLIQERAHALKPPAEVVAAVAKAKRDATWEAKRAGRPVPPPSCARCDKPRKNGSYCVEHRAQERQRTLEEKKARAAAHRMASVADAVVEAINASPEVDSPLFVPVNIEKIDRAIDPSAAFQLKSKVATLYDETAASTAAADGAAVSPRPSPPPPAPPQPTAPPFRLVETPPEQPPPAAIGPPPTLGIRREQLGKAVRRAMKYILSESFRTKEGTEIVLELFDAVSAL